MSTLASAALSSDDEEDQDFQLPAPKSKNGTKKRRRTTDSASGSSSSGSDDEVDAIDSAEALKLKADQEHVEAEERRKRAEAAFEAMRTQSETAVEPKIHSEPSIGLVEVKRARQFAGETISETITLPADHPDAIAYIQRLSKVVAAEVTLAEGSKPTTTILEATPSIAGPSKPKAKPPAKRKPRQSLEAMSAALDKGKKMTTLEKSQMDWKNHTAADRDINDELEANRKAGGYLQKKDFLERVGERRMDTFESKQRQR